LDIHINSQKKKVVLLKIIWITIATYNQTNKENTIGERN